MYRGAIIDVCDTVVVVDLDVANDDSDKSFRSTTRLQSKR